MHMHSRPVTIAIRQVSHTALRANVEPFSCTHKTPESLTLRGKALYTLIHSSFRRVDSQKRQRYFYSSRQILLQMDGQGLLKEAEKYSAIRLETWQGPSARGGRRHELLSAPDTDERSAPPITPPTASSMWARLSVATGSNAHGAAVVRLMQKHLLESVDRLSLDEIELMARRV